MPEMPTLPLLQPAQVEVPRMENRGLNIPGTHIETSPVSRMNMLLDERMIIQETDVMDKCEFFEKFINELSPFLDDKEEKDCREILEDAKFHAILVMQGKKNDFNNISSSLESGLRRKKTELEKKGVIK